MNAGVSRSDMPMKRPTAVSVRYAKLCIPTLPLKSKMCYKNGAAEIQAVCCTRPLYSHSVSLVV